MIIKKTHEAVSPAVSHQGIEEIAKRDIAVRINTNFKVSKKASQTRTEAVEAPVDRQTVMAAANMIQQLMLECTATSHHVQANTRKEKVHLLLDIEDSE